MNKRKSGQSLIEYMMPLLSARKQGDISAFDETEIENVRQIISFIDEIPGGFLIYRNDEAQTLVYANKALMDIFKCKSLDEFRKLTGNSFRGIVHPDDYARVAESINKQIFTGDDNLDYVEYRIVRKDGIVRLVEDYGHYIKSKASGEFYYVFISDATEKLTRRLSETAQKDQQLRELNEELTFIKSEQLRRLEIIEALSINYDSILYADLNANTVLAYRLSERLVYMFDKLEEAQPLDAYVEKYVKRWVHPEDRKRVKEFTSVEHIRKALAEKDTYYVNYRCIKDGVVQYIQLRMVNVNIKKDVPQVVMGYRNIDKELLQQIEQRKILEDALNKAKLADIAKNTFLSNMSHDMRTPLNAIFGYSALARKSNDPERVRGYLDKIEQAGNNILELVEKVLEVSYFESQDYTESKSECSIKTILTDLCDWAKSQAELKNIKISLDMNAVEHDCVQIDGTMMSRVLNQIVDNAVKYTPSDGSVEITVTETSAGKGVSTYVFSVTDTGIGIEPKALERVFEPFERINNTTASGIFGAGLGLPIAKHLTEIMGGTIECKSTPGVGSTFTVTLSLKTVEPESVEPAASEKSPMAGKKILIVEDNEINLEIETEMLEDEGFIIDAAPNGKIAVDMVTAAADDEYSLVLMDIQMPVMDGRQAARAIRALPDKKKANLPIIALSANAFESDKRASIEAGMDAHLTKPIDVDLVISTFSQVLEERK
ncbi:MAG: response regulator [Clostridiales bacterium]|nr:response regulator [Clostridiales bacterium]